MDEREMKNEVDEFADFCQAASRKLRAKNPTIKSVDVFSSIAFSLWREKVIPVRNGVIEEIADMIDHMGEGRRLEEYVGAIRALKTAPTSDKGGA